MKSTVSRRRLIITIAIVALIGFSFTACDNNGLGSYSLKGMWETSNGMRVSFSGSNAVFNNFGYLSGLNLSAVNKGYVKLGDRYLRSIKSTGSLSWSCQLLSISYYTSSPSVATGTTWNNATIVMSYDGQTIQVTGRDTVTTLTRW